MLRVDRLHLQNFRGFADATIDLYPGLTLLVANNGGGKTATLDALSIVLGSIVSSGIAKRLNVRAIFSMDPDAVRVLRQFDRLQEANAPH